MELNILTEDENVYQIMKLMMDRHGQARYSDLRTLTSDPVKMHIATFHKKLKELVRRRVLKTNGIGYTRPRIYQLSSKTLQTLDPCYSHLREVIKNYEEMEKESKNNGGKDSYQMNIQVEVKKIFESLLLITIFNATYGVRLKNKSIDTISFDNGMEFIFKIVLEEVSRYYNKIPLSPDVNIKEQLIQLFNGLDEDEAWFKETFKNYLSNYVSSPPP